MVQRKYISEFGLNMLADEIILLQQDQLHQVDNLGIEPHIYIIARRPRITINPEAFVFTEETISGEFKKQIKGEYTSIPFITKNNLGTNTISVKCEYPFTEFTLFGPDSNFLSGGKSALLLAHMGTKYWEHLDLEVLYVGQAYGTEGSRIASERLLSHSTLQGIYAEAIKNSPDQEIWLVLLSFQTLLMASFDGRSQTYGTSHDQDSDHIHSVTSSEITEQQKINFTEAALIKYFQAPYNQIYKNTFPNPAHSTYAECYDLDLNMISVELNTEEIASRLWSKSVEPKWINFCTFPLHSREERKYMFEMDGVDAI